VRVVYPGAQTATVQLYKRSYALLIGNSDYSAWSDLPGVRKDLTEVQRALEKQDFTIVSFKNQEPVFGQPVVDVNREEFRRQMDQFVDAYGDDEDNRLLIYYAGHGYTTRLSDGRKMGYLVMRDAPMMPPALQALDQGLTREQFVPFWRNSVNMDELETIAKRINARHVLFVFDSCFAGTVLFRDGETTIPTYINQEVVQPVRAFLTAGNELQAVPDESEFRKAFVHGLEGAADTWDADHPRDGYILASELYYYIKKTVAGTKTPTTPLFGKIGVPELARGDFVFVVGVAAPPLPTALRPTRPLIVQPDAPPVLGSEAGIPKSPEGVFWDAVKESSDPKDFDSFLISYPKGVFTELARFRRDKLRTAAEIAKYRNPPQGLVLSRSLAKDTPMEFVSIPAGTFMMGPSKSEENQGYSGSPQRRVTIKEGFWMGEYEVTRSQWKAVMGKDNSFFGRDCTDCPVSGISWNDAKQFLQKLNERNDGFEYRLPTEAEWEYAARANTQTRFYWGDDSSNSSICFYANVADKTPLSQNDFSRLGGSVSCEDGFANVSPVGKFSPNTFGLFDMIGNVDEWCEDVLSWSTEELPVDGSANLTRGELDKRVTRGGSCFSPQSSLGTSYGAMASPTLV
jgi:formylglycine-generating enzyme required for sulfatase activity